MKKIVMFLLMGMLMVPSEVYSKLYYRERHVRLHMPTRIPSLYDVNVYVDSETGDLEITSANYVIGLNINITGNGMTYLNSGLFLNGDRTNGTCWAYLRASCTLWAAIALLVFHNRLHESFQRCIECDRRSDGYAERPSLRGKKTVQQHL